MKKQPRAPEIHDVRTWTAVCPLCGRPVTYHGMYEGENKTCAFCEDALVELEEERKLEEQQRNEPDTRFGNWDDMED